MSINEVNFISEINSNNNQPSDTKRFLIGGLIFIAVIVFGALFLIFQFSNISLFNQQTIIFEPSCYTTQNCDEELLTETAELLSNRANAIGYGSTTFKVHNNHLIYAKVPKDFDRELFLSVLKNNHLLEFVDFGDTYMMEGTLVQTSTDDNEVDNESIYLTVLTNQNIRSAKVVNQNGQTMIAFEFDAEGSSIFTNFTVTHIGKYLGIVLDKEVLSCPYINSPITGGIGMIQGDFTYERAIELAGSIAAKPLPYDVILHEAD